MEELAKLIEAITPVLWLLLVVFVIFKFAPAVKEIIESAKWRKFTLKIGGQELTMEELTEQQSKLLLDLQAQFEALRAQVLPKKNQIEKAVETATQTPVPRKAVLWVDDNPKNNGLLVQMLRDKEIAVDIALSTQEATQRFESERYGAVVSDMGREESGQYRPDAGITFLKKVRERDTQIPFIVYCSTQKAREYREQALRLGATDVTSSPADVSGALLRHFGVA